MGWHYYLQDTIQFPFAATCIERASTSPLREGQVLQIVSMADEDDCCTEMRVNIEYDHALLGGAAGAVAMRACKR